MQRCQGRRFLVWGRAVDPVPEGLVVIIFGDRKNGIQEGGAGGEGRVGVLDRSRSRLWRANRRQGDNKGRARVDVEQVEKTYVAKLRSHAHSRLGLQVQGGSVVYKVGGAIRVVMDEEDGVPEVPKGDWVGEEGVMG